MGLLDSFTQKQNLVTGEGELIDLGLDSKIYYDGPDGVQRSGNANYGNYQFTSLEDIINSFIVAYVGEDKLISKVSRTDIGFHAQRALAELSFDTLKSVKSFELEVPPSGVSVHTFAFSGHTFACPGHTFACPGHTFACP